MPSKRKAKVYADVILDGAPPRLEAKILKTVQKFCAKHPEVVVQIHYGTDHIGPAEDPFPEDPFPEDPYPCVL